jgi:hypothetical protein
MGRKRRAVTGNEVVAASLVKAQEPSTMPPPEPPKAVASFPSEAKEARLKVYDRVLATVSALSLIVGGVWAVYINAEARNKEIGQRAEELRTRDRELRLQVFKDRKGTYMALCDAVGDVVACRDREEVKAKARTFIKLYVGRAHIIVDDDDVSKKKKGFWRAISMARRKCLRKPHLNSSRNQHSN